MSAPAVTTPSTPDLLYSEVEDDLRDSVRALLEKRCPWDAVLARIESADTTDLDLWATLATDIGCAGLAVPERRGGAGASWREAAVVAEELGRAVAPVPFLGAAVATATLLASGVDAPDLLAATAAGERTTALAVPATSAPGRVTPSVRRAVHGLTGEVRGVLDAGHADVLLVPLDDALVAVEAAAVARTPVVSLDMTRPLVDVALADVAATTIAGGEAARAAVVHGLRIGAVLLASEQLGLAERCLEMTVEYLAVRRQFGRVLGSYQALKHRLADLWVEVTQARAAARHAAACAADDADDLAIAAAVAVAQAHVSEVALHVAEECVQMHGGIGFTWEHPAHLYLKRARADAAILGTADRHRAALAGLVGLDAAGAGR